MRKRMTEKFNMNFWNYVPTGTLSADAVKDWRELGFSGAMSFEYDSRINEPCQMLEVLDECEKQNINVIVCDKRSNYKTLIEVGEEHFTKDFMQAALEFGAHNAVVGFHIGDEPNKEQMSFAIKAYKIVKRLCPQLTPFINFFPMWKAPNFKDCLGVESENYGELLDDIVKNAELEVLCYDCYTQLTYFDKEKEINNYFRNLNIFGETARKNNIPLYTSLLSVAHWGYRPQTEDDFRWQISTAVAHGCTGLFWFFVYERNLDESFRESPIDEFYNRTETFDRLKRQNNIFMKHYAQKVMQYDFKEVYHVGKAYGDTPLWQNKHDDDVIAEVSDFVGNPISVTKFERGDKKAVMVVNLSQTEPTKPKITFTTTYQKSNCEFWLAPGQLRFIELV